MARAFLQNPLINTTMDSRVSKIREILSKLREHIDELERFSVKRREYLTPILGKAERGKRKEDTAHQLLVNLPSSLDAGSLCTFPSSHPILSTFLTSNSGT